MTTTQVDERRPAGLTLDVPELRLPLSTDGPAAMPELAEGDGPSRDAGSGWSATRLVLIV
ncbi:hypothetical protein ACO0M4_21315 [Streptomyces sp. RGM 3693]|uniref:hypothetical protein n=1 Tax=Streptomyces sp. RGM 3693 TaxID=3413284 RepID=UPI003D2793BE